MSEQDTSNSRAAPDRDPKKRKLDDQPETPLKQPPISPPFKKHEDLWFEDGSIVLIAKDVGFKVGVLLLLQIIPIYQYIIPLQVYSGILSRHSEVFRDMFTLPQPPDASLFGGCHTVYLEDHPDDLAFVLKAMYDSTSR